VARICDTRLKIEILPRKQKQRGPPNFPTLPPDRPTFVMIYIRSIDPSLFFSPPFSQSGSPKEKTQFCSPWPITYMSLHNHLSKQKKTPLRACSVEVCFACCLDPTSQKWAGSNAYFLAIALWAPALTLSPFGNHISGVGKRFICTFAQRTPTVFSFFQWPTNMKTVFFHRMTACWLLLTGGDMEFMEHQQFCRFHVVV